MPPSNGVSVLQLALFRGYVSLVEQLGRMRSVTWVPLFGNGLLPFMRMPVFRTTLQVFVSSHIRRVVEALNRAYLLRSAIKQPEQDDWNSLHEQADALLGGVPSAVLSKWLLAILVFIIVFLTGRLVPQSHLALTAKIVIAVMTVDAEKITELAAEPDIGSAVGGLALGAFVLLFVVTPIVIYHFRFKRMLFNYPDSPSAVDPRKALAITNIWKQKLTLAGSLYAREMAILAEIGAPPTREIAMDLLPPIIIFGCYAVGPGLVVGIVACKVWPANRSAAATLFFVAAINLLIGLGNVALCLKTIGARSNVQPAAT
jgi:hypothetical protein